MAVEALCGTSAVDPLIDMPAEELLRLIHDRKIRDVMIDGIAHVSDDAIQEHRDGAAS